MRIQSEFSGFHSPTYALRLSVQFVLNHPRQFLSNRIAQRTQRLDMHELHVDEVDFVGGSWSRETSSTVSNVLRPILTGLGRHVYGFRRSCSPNMIGLEKKRREIAHSLSSGRFCKIFLNILPGLSLLSSVRQCRISDSARSIEMLFVSFIGKLKLSTVC